MIPSTNTSRPEAPPSHPTVATSPVGVEPERRMLPRELSCGPIWWKGPNDDEFRQGWLIDRSGSGVAFLVRGAVPVVVGQRMEISTSTPTDVGFMVDDALAARIVHVHADLHLVAAQIKPA